MKSSKWILAVVALAILALTVANCGGRSNRRQSGEWTPSAVTGSLEIGTRAPDILPTLPPSTRLPEPTVPVPTVALATVAPTKLLAATAAPTRDPNLVVITESDVLRAVTSGAAADSGATLDNVDVQFTADGKMILTAGRVGYGFINASNVTLVGRLVAVEGKLQLQTESITPQGMVTALIPTIANQALQRYTSKWYIEDVRTSEGQIELRVRP